MTHVERHRSPPSSHEQIGDCLALMVALLVAEWRIPCAAGGSTTLKRREVKKGAEPDRCFWIGGEPKIMVNRRLFNLAIDPAPDLVIEVNYTSSSIDRMAIYAAFGIKEIWRWDEELEFLELVEGDYRPITVSLALPMLSLKTAREFLGLSTTTDVGAFVLEFQRHIRENRPQA